LTDYRFRPVVADDLPLLRIWLTTPAVARWWPDPDAQYAGLVEDLDGDAMTMLIVSHRGRPFAYLQHANAHGWGDFTRGLPADARALDAFIGEPDMVGIGHGSAFLRVAALDLHRRYSALMIDPAPDNLQAIRAYHKAGFRGEAIVDTPDGPARLMTFAG
jgi:aminoglycoside 6'-N-acetyltransferase